MQGLEGEERKSCPNKLKYSSSGDKAQQMDEAALRQEHQRLKEGARPATEIENREMEEQEAVSQPTSEKESLKKVVEKLTSHDKIVQIHFDELATDGTIVYSRAEDRFVGCEYSDGSPPKIEVHQTVLVFGVQSVFTAFNILLGCYPLTSNRKGMEKRLEDNLKLAEEVGLVVKAVVCKGGSINKEALKNFSNGIYLRM
uniref:Transposable element P transposase-like RNase H domain-containing protein n=1 Tax=Glossina pallidipes TaxID=7398 RepID=A0A1B0A216_GLOPL